MLQGGPEGRSVRPLTLGDTQRGVIGRFEDVVAAQPHSVAVIDERGSTTFAELASDAARTCALIRREVAGHVDTQGDPVAIALLHSHDAAGVAALYGILASGHPVIVLDARTPAARLQAFAQRAETTICLTDAANATLAGTVVTRVLRADTAAPAEVDTLWATPPSLDAAAALSFTSGSTGAPKGVVNVHAALVRDAWVNSVQTGCYTQDDVVAHTLPMAFHAGLMVTVAGVLVGTTMAMYDVRSSGIGGLAGWIEQTGVTVMHASPAILRAFVGTGPSPQQLARLTSLTVAGEAAHGRDVQSARALLPATCTVRNRYGSSETGLISDYAVPGDHPALEGPLPAGYPVGDTVLRVVGPDGEELPAGEPGVLTVTTRFMAQGYWRDAAKTAEVFTDNADGTRTYRTSDIARLDPHGPMQILGRRDHSVKIRGYLVEPAEVDAALFAFPDVREAVTVGSPRPGDGQMRLVAYVVSSAERPSAVVVRSRLHETLPGYMVPETIVFLETLPRTERGKLDRSALPEPPAVVVGRSNREWTEWERVVGNLWASVLALPAVGLEDDFFELGGDSLAAESMTSRLVSELGVPAAAATTTTLVQAPTLMQFAARVKRIPSGDGTLVPLRTTGSRTPLFMVAGGGGLGVGMVPLVSHLHPEQPVYALQAKALEQRGIPDWSVEAIARRHVGTIQRVQRQGPYYIAGHSFGGLVALEVAHQLKAAGQDVALLIVLDSFPPDPSRHPKRPPMGPLMRLKDLAGLAATGLTHARGLGGYWRFHRQSMVLGLRYRCAPWPGETVVVVADSEDHDARADWAPHLSGDWRLVEIGGDHMSMMRDPYAAETAEVIDGALARVRRSRGGGSQIDVATTDPTGSRRA